jgi:hypothetical protein
VLTESEQFQCSARDIGFSGIRVRRDTLRSQLLRAMI